MRDQLEAVIVQKMPTLKRLARRYVRNEADVDDVVQDGILRAYQFIDQFQGRSQLGTWVGSIVITAALMHLRRDRRKSAKLEALPEDENTDRFFQVFRDKKDTPETTLLRKEQVQTVREIVAELPASQQVTLRFKLDNDGCTLQEMAEAQDIAVQAVKARLFHGKRYIAERIG